MDSCRKKQNLLTLAIINSRFRFETIGCHYCSFRTRVTKGDVYVAGIIRSQVESVFNIG